MTDHSDWEFFQDEGYFGMWCVRENGVRRFGEGFHTVSEEEAEALASALSSQPLSLSEAREEIERLTKQKGLLVRQSNAAIRERDEALAALREKEERVKAAIKLVDGYGIVLTMIAAGCSDPQRFAKRMLAEHDAEAKQLGIVK